jgi:hypothetical protein
MQGEIDFNSGKIEEINEIRNRRLQGEEEEKEKPETTLRKVKHMQNLLKKEGITNKTMKENIETFEDVPAYIRRNMSIGTKENENESKVSKFTLTSGDDNEPVLRENNAYLNNNVD